MLDARPVGTPTQPNENLPKSTKTNSELQRKFREIVGVVMYLAVQTRPDISNAVRAVARHMVSPAAVHMSAAKRILRYLAGTQDVVLAYRGDSVNL